MIVIKNKNYHPYTFICRQAFICRQEGVGIILDNIDGLVFTMYFKDLAVFNGSSLQKRSTSYSLCL